MTATATREFCRLPMPVPAEEFAAVLRAVAECHPGATADGMSVEDTGDGDWLILRVPAEDVAP